MGKMQSRNKFFDDAAKVAGSAAGLFAGVKRELDTAVRQQLQGLLASMDLVTRDEFDAVKEMAALARRDQELVLKRIAELEKELDNPTKAKRKSKKIVPKQRTKKQSARKDTGN